MLMSSLPNATAPAPYRCCTQNNAIDDNIGHIDKQIDRADSEDDLLFLVINVNDCSATFKFDNVYGCHPGARVFDTECDHICVLQAYMEDVLNNMINEIIGHLGNEIDRTDLEGIDGMKTGAIMFQFNSSVCPD